MSRTMRRLLGGVPAQPGRVVLAFEAVQKTPLALEARQAALAEQVLLERFEDARRKRLRDLRAYPVGEPGAALRWSLTTT